MTYSYILITRGQEDAIPLAENLERLGFRPIVDSLFKIKIKNNISLNLDGVQALLMTSANGVRAFAQGSSVRNLPTCAVGDATAQTAKEKGFRSILSAQGNVSDLFKLVSKSFSPKAGTLLHTTGTRVAGDLGRQLEKYGFTYRREVLYEVTEKKGFSKRTLKAFAEKKILYILLYSPRTAELFQKLARNSGIDKNLGETWALCLSEAVAKEISGLSWKKIFVSELPNQQSLLNFLKLTI